MRTCIRNLDRKQFNFVIWTGNNLDEVRKIFVGADVEFDIDLFSLKVPKRLVVKDSSGNRQRNIVVVGGTYLINEDGIPVLRTEEHFNQHYTIYQTKPEPYAVSTEESNRIDEILSGGTFGKWRNDRKKDYMSKDYTLFHKEWTEPNPSVDVFVVTSLFDPEKFEPFIGDRDFVVRTRWRKGYSTFLDVSVAGIEGSIIPGDVIIRYGDKFVVVR